MSERDKNSKIKLVIFDLDGTLVDTMASIIKTSSLMLEELKLSLVEEKYYNYYVGNGAYNLVKRLVEHEQKGQDIQEAYQVYLKYFQDYDDYEAKPFPGIEDLLVKLKPQYKLAVLTNKPDQNAKSLVAKLFPGTFDYVRGLVDGEPFKPDRLALDYVCDQLGLPSHSAVLVGDSDADMQTAVNAGIPGIGVTWGFRPQAELQENGASITVDRASEIESYLAGL